MPVDSIKTTAEKTVIVLVRDKTPETPSSTFVAFSSPSNPHNAEHIFTAIIHSSISVITGMLTAAIANIPNAPTVPLIRLRLPRTEV